MQGSAQTITPLRIVPRAGLCSACQVRSVAACSALDNDELQRLASIVTEKKYGAGATIFEQGDEPAYIFNLTSGHVRLAKTLANGRRQIIGFVYPGGMLGLATHGAYVCSAEAIGPVKLCRFPRDRLLALLEELPSLKTRLLDIAADELGDAQEQMLLLGRKTPLERVASFLWRQYQEAVRCGQTEPSIDLPMGRTDIADYLGTTIETVSRTFTRLRNDGLIRLEHANKVIILDAQGLEEIAEGL